MWRNWEHFPPNSSFCGENNFFSGTGFICKTLWLEWQQYILGIPGSLSIPNPKTIKKHPKKNSLYSQKWNFLAQNIKKILIFSSKKAVLIFPETKLSSSNIKKISNIFSKKRFSYIFRNRTMHFSAKALEIKELHFENPEKSLYLIFFIRIFSHLTFFHTFFIRIFFIIRIFFHLNFFQ